MSAAAARSAWARGPAPLKVEYSLTTPLNRERRTRANLTGHINGFSAAELGKKDTLDLVKLAISDITDKLQNAGPKAVQQFGGIRFMDLSAADPDAPAACLATITLALSDAGQAKLKSMLAAVADYAGDSVFQTPAILSGPPTAPSYIPEVDWTVEWTEDLIAIDSYGWPTEFGELNVREVTRFALGSPPARVATHVDGCSALESGDRCILYFPAGTKLPGNLNEPPPASGRKEREDWTKYLDGSKTNDPTFTLRCRPLHRGNYDRAFRNGALKHEAYSNSKQRHQPPEWEDAEDPYIGPWADDVDAAEAEAAAAAATATAAAAAGAAVQEEEAEGSGETGGGGAPAASTETVGVAAEEQEADSTAAVEAHPEGTDSEGGERAAEGGEGLGADEADPAAHEEPAGADVPADLGGAPNAAAGAGDDGQLPPGLLRAAAAVDPEGDDEQITALAALALPQRGGAGRGRGPARGGATGRLSGKNGRGGGSTGSSPPGKKTRVPLPSETDLDDAGGGHAIPARRSLAASWAEVASGDPI